MYRAKFGEFSGGGRGITISLFVDNDSEIGVFYGIVCIVVDGMLVSIYLQQIKYSKE